MSRRSSSMRLNAQTGFIKQCVTTAPSLHNSNEQCAICLEANVDKHLIISTYIKTLIRLINIHMYWLTMDFLLYATMYCHIVYHIILINTFMIISRMSHLKQTVIIFIIVVPFIVPWTSIWSISHRSRPLTIPV